jgi:competence protein ComEC
MVTWATAALTGRASTGDRPGGNPDPDGVVPLGAVVLGIAAALAAPHASGTGWPLGAAAIAAGLAVTLPLRAPRKRVAVLSARLATLPAVVPGARLVAPGVLALAMLVLVGAAVTGARLAVVRDAVLPKLVGEPVTVRGVVTAEPEHVRYGGRRVRLTVTWVEGTGANWRTHERAALVLPAGAGPVMLGDTLSVAATVRPAKRTDALGWRPLADLGRPFVLARAPSEGHALRLSAMLRARAREQALASLPPEQAGLLAGMALGDTAALRGDVEDAFESAGLTHLVAVSGANLAVVTGAVLGVALLLGARRRALALIGVLLVAAFTFLTRWEPSVLRAAVMAVLVLLGVATGRGPGGRRALCLAVTILLLADPALAMSLGFALSVAATAGILWLGPPLARALPDRLPEIGRVAIAGTLAAQAAALPLAGLATGDLPLMALPANLLAIPLAAAPMLLGVINAVAAPVLPWVADLACVLAKPFLTALIWLARWSQRHGGLIATPNGAARFLLLGIPVVLVMALHRATRGRSSDLMASVPSGSSGGRGWL